jgi:hypothetical protein
VSLPNAFRGEILVIEHDGDVMAAMLAYPDPPEFDDIQAYRSRQLGRCPPGWRPPAATGPAG